MTDVKDTVTDPDKGKNIGTRYRIEVREIPDRVKIPGVISPMDFDMVDEAVSWLRRHPELELVAFSKVETIQIDMTKFARAMTRSHDLWLARHSIASWTDEEKTLCLVGGIEVLLHAFPSAAICESAYVQSVALVQQVSRTRMAITAKNGRSGPDTTVSKEIRRLIGSARAFIGHLGPSPTMTTHETQLVDEVEKQIKAVEIIFDKEGSL